MVFYFDQQASLFDGAFWMLEKLTSEEMKVMRPSLPAYSPQSHATLIEARTLRLFEIGHHTRKMEILFSYILAENAPRMGYRKSIISTLDAKGSNPLSGWCRVGNEKMDGTFYHPGSHTQLVRKYPGVSGC